jgi:hypothetical protein
VIGHKEQEAVAARGRAEANYERGQEPGLEFELAHAYCELADVRREGSALPEAIVLFHQGLALTQGLVQSNPGELKYQRRRAFIHCRLAGLYVETRATGEAAKEFETASTLRSIDPRRRVRRRR